ncbi:hypothetical protein M513_09696 [Trichuris suis]|uniref:GOLD domain-containing protein n=1 Tax=Trichuris suis TaxID=68888 RepID=A0A085LWT3_9BILA|nr:hypothetical protein M513_09696 [Trichuris suis]
MSSCGCGVTMNLLGVLIVLLFITCRTVGREESFSIVIPASRLQCFFESVREDNFTTMVFDYQVLYGGDLDINVLVLDPKADVVAQDTRKSEGSYHYQTAKTVFFQVELLRADGTTDDFGVSALNDPTGIVTHVGLFSEVLKERLQRLRQKLTAAERFQALARAHETRDRLLMDEKLNRVNFWSMFNMSSLLIVGGLQSFTLEATAKCVDASSRKSLVIVCIRTKLRQKYRRIASASIAIDSLLLDRKTMDGSNLPDRAQIRAATFLSSSLWHPRSPSNRQCALGRQCPLGQRFKQIHIQACAAGDDSKAIV